MVAATEHDRLAARDYAQLRSLGIRTVRDGIRWHRVEPRPGQYRAESFLPMIRAAKATGTQVIWDLMHYGWPDDLDPFRPAFIDRFSRMVRFVAEVVASETDEVPYFCPVNEMSFLAWGGGDVGYMNPFAHGRGLEFKVQLVRTAMAATDTLRSVDPRCRIVNVDPAIHIAPPGPLPRDIDHAEGARMGQFEAWDLLTGRRWPGLGGAPHYLDIIGVNYYYNNQWFLGGAPITRPNHPRYRPLREMLAEVHARYRRPLFLSETGIDAQAHMTGKPIFEIDLASSFDARPVWLRYVADEVAAAIASGVPVGGICLYPVANHPGWDDDRHCQNGLLDYPDADGNRPVVQPLAAELARQIARFS